MHSALQFLNAALTVDASQLLWGIVTDCNVPACLQTTHSAVRTSVHEPSGPAQKRLFIDLTASPVLSSALSLGCPECNALRVGKPPLQTHRTKDCVHSSNNMHAQAVLL